MKKITTFWLAILLACGTMIGCQMKSPDDKADTAETLPPFEDVIKEYDQDDSQQGFSIKGKRYYYKGNAVMDEFDAGVFPAGVFPAGEVLILNVTNETDTNYTATLTVSYADENGKIIKTEKQVFKEFAAGYQKYFLFEPRNSYASYACELSLTDYTGEINVDKFSCELASIDECDFWIGALQLQDDYKKYPTIMAKFVTKLLPHPEIWISRIHIIFDNKGEIYLIRQGVSAYQTELTEDWFSLPICQTTEGKLTWPEELTGEVNGIVIYDIVDKGY